MSDNDKITSTEEETEEKKDGVVSDDILAAFETDDAVVDEDAIVAAEGEDDLDMEFMSGFEDRY